MTKRRTLVAAVLMTATFMFVTLGCENLTGADEGEKDTGAGIESTSFIITLPDTAAGSAIPSSFKVHYKYAISDKEFVSGSEYSVQASFAGSSVEIPVGTPFSLKTTAQTGEGDFTFAIPETGLPDSVKKSPYELTFNSKKAGAETGVKSTVFKFTEGKMTGTYTGQLYYYGPGITFDANGQPAGNDYWDKYYRIHLVQYGTMLIGTQTFYWSSDIPTETSCNVNVVMRITSQTGSKAVVEGSGTYTNASGASTTYSGEATIYKDGLLISCDKYWLASDTVKTPKGMFDANKTGTAKISGTVTIDGATVDQMKKIYADRR